MYGPGNVGVGEFCCIVADTGNGAYRVVSPYPADQVNAVLHGKAQIAFSTKERFFGDYGDETEIITVCRALGKNSGNLRQWLKNCE